MTENHGVPGSNPGPATSKVPAKPRKGRDPEQPFIPSDRVEQKREPFGRITEYLRDRFDLPQEPNIAAQYRGAALMEAGLLLSEQTMSPLPSDDIPTLSYSQERFLDSEFVAIYW